MKRREFIQSLVASSALAMTISPSVALAEEAKPKKKGPNDMDYKTALDTITNKKEAKDSDKIKLTVPEIAENGAVVPVKVEVDHPMEETNYVKAIHILNTKNGNARCADVNLTPINGKGYFSTSATTSWWNSRSCSTC